jgi:hypothetical protein
MTKFSLNTIITGIDEVELKAVFRAHAEFVDVSLEMICLHLQVAATRRFVETVGTVNSLVRDSDAGKEGVGLQKPFRK